MALIRSVVYLRHIESQHDGPHLALRATLPVADSLLKTLAFSAGTDGLRFRHKLLWPGPGAQDSLSRRGFRNYNEEKTGRCTTTQKR
jgi:hypothetical protein